MMWVMSSNLRQTSDSSKPCSKADANVGHADGCPSAMLPHVHLYRIDAAVCLLALALIGPADIRYLANEAGLEVQMR